MSLFSRIGPDVWEQPDKEEDFQLLQCSNA